MTAIYVIIAIFAFGFIIFFHELFHYLAARAVGVKPKEFAIGFGKSLVVYQKKKFFFLPKKEEEKYDLNEISYHIKLLPLGGYVLFERPVKNENGELEVKGEYFKVHPLKRIFISLAGPLGNLLLAFILMFTLFSPYMSLHQDGKVIHVAEPSIAYSSGIKAQDKILSLNGNDFSSLSDVSTYVTSQDNLCIEWEHKGDIFKKCVRNHHDSLGVTFSLSIPQGISATALSFVDLLKNYISSFITVLMHLHIEDFSGPVGTVDAIQQAVPVTTDFLGILISINIALGAANLLLPLSVTDGGKIIIDVICLIRRKKHISTTYLDIISFILMIGLFVTTFFLDISRIIDRFF